MIEDYYTPGWTIQRAGQVQNEWGDWVDGWADHLTNVEGRMRALSGSERYSADKQTFFGTHRFYTSVANIKVTDRIVKEGTTYDIKFVNNVMEFDEFLQCDVEVVI